jgi:hypothetical protein
MEIRITTQQILNVLQVLSWIIFIGLCIEAGGVIFNACYVLFYNPAGVYHYADGSTLAALLNYSQSQYIVQVTLMAIVGVLRALMFYLIVKVLYEKKLDMAKPFNMAMNRFMSNMAYLCLGIALFSAWGAGCVTELVAKGVLMPTVEVLNLGGADVWLFMSITLFIIVQIFKRGMELQQENDLTI